MVRSLLVTVWLKDNTGLGGETSLIVSPVFTKISVTKRLEHLARAHLPLSNVTLFYLLSLLVLMCEFVDNITVNHYASTLQNVLSQRP